MKKGRKAFRNFMSVLLVFVLCFTAALTAFADESQSEESAADEQISVLSEEMTESGEEETSEEESVLPSDPTEGDPNAGQTGAGSAADMDAAIAEIAQVLRSEYGDEAAASFERMMDNANMRAFIAALQNRLEAEFPDMSDEEISRRLENMSEEEALALMERIFNDPEILALSEAVSVDEELAGEMEKMLEFLFGDELDTDEKPKLEKPVSGAQGDNISWNLDTNGTLTLSGSGEVVPSYEEFEGIRLPFYGWDDYMDKVAKVVIKDGVTAVPEAVFACSSTLKTVVVPASVKTIGSEAFAYCSNLTAVYFQGDAPDIAEDAFDECSKDLTLYYREGTKGWDKVTGCKLAVWTAALSGGSSEENGKAPAADNTQGASSQAASGAAAGSSTNGTPNTGDTNNVWPFVILMAAAVICGGAVIIRMRKKR